MSLEAVSGSVSANSIFSMVGDVPWCPNHGYGLCGCTTSGVWTDSTYTVPQTTCPNCGTTYLGMYHVCGGSCSPPLVFPVLEIPECALCDAVLKFGEKKLCAECRGVVEAWRFLSKKDPEGEKGSE